MRRIKTVLAVGVVAIAMLVAVSGTAMAQVFPSILLTVNLSKDSISVRGRWST